MKKKIILLPILMMALAACGGNTDSVNTPDSAGTLPPTSEGGDPSVEVPPSVDTPDSSEADVEKTIAQLKELGANLATDGKEYTTERYTTVGTIIAVQGNSLFIQDGDDGILVYNAPNGSSYLVGERIKVTTNLSNYNGIVQMSAKDYKNVPTEVEKVNETVAIEPFVVTTFDPAALGPKSPCLVKVDGIKITEAGLTALRAWDGASTFTKLTLELAGSQFTGTINKFVADRMTIKDNLLKLDLADETFDFVGVLDAYKGKGQITLTSMSEITLHEHVEVNVPTTGITLAVKDDAAAEVEVERNLQLTATVEPANATNKSVTYEVTEGGEFATVDATTGVVTGLAEGTAKVVAKQGEITSNEVSVLVKAKTAKPTESITIDGPTSVTMGSTITFTFATTPVDADNQEHTWVSSDTTVATIDNNGVLTPVKEGTTEITATQDALTSNKITVTVEAAPVEETPAFVFDYRDIDDANNDKYNVAKTFIAKNNEQTVDFTGIGVARLVSTSAADKGTPTKFRFGTKVANMQASNLLEEGSASVSVLNAHTNFDKAVTKIEIKLIATSSNNTVYIPKYLKSIILGVNDEFSKISESNTNPTDKTYLDTVRFAKDDLVISNDTITFTPTAGISWAAGSEFRFMVNSDGTNNGVLDVASINFYTE